MITATIGVVSTLHLWRSERNLYAVYIVFPVNLNHLIIIFMCRDRTQPTNRPFRLLFSVCPKARGGSSNLTSFPSGGRTLREGHKQNYFKCYKLSDPLAYMESSNRSPEFFFILANSHSIFVLRNASVVASNSGPPKTIHKY